MKNSSLVLFLFVLVFCSCERQIDTVERTEADFSWSMTNTPGQIRFTNLSKNATSYSWSFGNGLTGIDKDPQVLYDRNGDFVVALTAKGQSGESTAIKTLTINNAAAVGSVLFWTTYNGRVFVTVNGVNAGQTSIYYSNNVGPECGTPGNVTVTLPEGVYNFTAKSDNLFPITWSGQIRVLNGQCRRQLLPKP